MLRTVRTRLALNNEKKELSRDSLVFRGHQVSSQGEKVILLKGAGITVEKRKEAIHKSSTSGGTKRKSNASA